MAERMNTPPTISLSSEQELAITHITDWLKSDRQEFHFGGYAGTGKTTVIKFLLESLRLNVAVCAFTGKAVSVLQKKGIFIAETIHSLIYDVEVESNGMVSFHKKHRLPADPQLIIIDEASMVSTELYNDLKSFGKKLLFVGDPAQLEPVGDNPNLMRTTDFVLKTIHRQAESSPIITLASSVRSGKPITLTQTDGLWVKNKDLTAPIMLAADQVIVAKNTTRKKFNERFRQHFKYPKNQVVVGDKLICLRNNAEFSVFNGMIFFVREIHSEYASHWLADCEDELGKKLPKLRIWKDPYQVDLEKDARIPRDYVYSDFGYAITCHKSQGSEWDSVLVFDEYMPPHVWDMKRWRYTAITRAAKNLVYCI